jgi:outer membrane lipoprotein-sorting protein
MLKKKSLFLSVPLCLCFSLALATADSKTGTKTGLTAAQIVEKNVAARGGLKNWRAVQSMSWTGKLDAGGGSVDRSRRYVENSRRRNPSKVALTNNPDAAAKAEDTQVQLPFVMEMTRPNKSRVEIQFAGKTAVQVYDGANGWKVRPYLNRNDVEPFTAEETKSEAGKGALDGPLVDYAAKGTKVELEAIEPVEGQNAYKLKLTNKNGDVQHIWIDAESFLDVKVEGAPHRMDGRMRTVWIYQRDFRSVQGVMVPFALETAVDGYKETHKMVIEKVEVNPKLDDALFVKPKV